MLFFSFARSVLPAYVLPGVPGLALCLGYFIRNYSQAKAATVAVESSAVSRGIGIFSRPQYSHIAGIGLGMAIVMSAIILIVGPMAGARKSSEQILEVIAQETRAENPLIGTVSTGNYSPFWTSGAFEEELSKPVNVIYVKPEDVESAKYRNLVVRDKGEQDFLIQNGTNYKKVMSRGYWSWYRRKRKLSGRGGRS